MVRLFTSSWRVYISYGRRCIRLEFIFKMINNWINQTNGGWINGWTERAKFMKLSLSIVRSSLQPTRFFSLLPPSVSLYLSPPIPLSSSATLSSSILYFSISLFRYLFLFATVSAFYLHKYIPLYFNMWNWCRYRRDVRTNRLVVCIRIVMIILCSGESIGGCKVAVARMTDRFDAIMMIVEQQKESRC